MHGYYFLFLLFVPVLILPAYATHYDDYGFDDAFYWREWDNDNAVSVFCRQPVLGSAGDLIKIECEDGVFNGTERQGVMVIMKTFLWADVQTNGVSEAWTWYFDQQCDQATCPGSRIEVWDGDYVSLLNDTTTYFKANQGWTDGYFPAISGAFGNIARGAAGNNVPPTGSGAGNGNQFSGSTTTSKGSNSQTLTITDANFAKATSSYGTVMLIMDKTTTLAENHYLNPRYMSVTNTPYGTLTWNFPETIPEGTAWEDHGGMGELILNGTEADKGYFWSYDPSVPDAPTLLYAVEGASTTSLYWTAPVFDGYSDITGYKIERECPAGAGFTTLVANTGSTTTGYTDSSPGTDCNYRVRALNTYGESLPSNESTDYTGPTGSDPTDLHPDDISCTQPTDELYLTIYAVSTTSATLCWNNNFSIGSGNFTWTQINYTTPFGDPQTEYVNSTEVNYTTWVLTGLTPGTQYSTQVTLANDNPYTNSSNIANFTTLPNNFVIGQIFDNATNPNTLRIPFDFDRTDLNGTSVQIDVSYPDTYNTTCIIEYEFARTNSTYSNLSTTALDNNRVQASFVFLNPTNDLIQMYCYDENDTTENARYVLTWGTFPLKEMFDNFRNGTYGTVGGFGTLDLATMLILTVAMIGFNRTNQIVGVIVAIGVVGITWVLGIITLPALIVIPPLALIGVLAFASYSRSDG